MRWLAIYSLLLFAPWQVTGQLDFDPDTVQFVQVSGPDLSEIFKNDLLIDQRGLLWVATQLGLFAYDGYDWKSGLAVPDDPLFRVDQWLENVQADTAGYIWFGSQVSGVHRLDVLDGTITPFTGGEFTGDPIHTILGNELPLINHHLIVQTNRGLLRLDPYSGNYVDFFIPFPEMVDGTAFGVPGASRANSIHHYLPDERDPGIIWLGTRDGMLRWNQREESIEILDWPFDNPNLPAGQKIAVVDIHQSGDSLLIGTYGSGLISYAKDLSGWHTHLLQPMEAEGPRGFWTNVVQQMTPLNDSTILFGSNLGPGVFHWNTHEIRFFSTLAEENAPGGIMTPQSSTFRNIVVDHNGCVWTNNYNGVYRSVAPLFAPRHKAELLITSCAIAEGPKWKGYLADGDSQVELRDYQNALEVSYALVNPVHPGAVRYAYRLKGFDRGWVEAGDRRFVRYANLKGGRYTLAIRATDHDGTVHEKELFKFRVETPFYKTSWFILAVATVILTTLYFFYRQHISNIREQESLKAEFDLKLSTMEMQALRSQMSPHFIFNSLNSIKYYVINKDSDEAADYLTKFSQLIRVILENSKSDLLTLEQEIRALRLYSEIENMRFDEEFELKFEIDPQIDLERFKIPPMLIQPHIENAIWHGLMHKKGERMLTVRFEKAEDGVLCVVEDNGIGRTQAAELAKTRKHKKQSLGTKITSDRIAMINKLYHTNVRTTVEDLFDANGKASGTRVRIFIEEMPE